MQFNPDPNKQANKVIFPRKSNSCSRPPVNFNNNDFNKYSHHKNLDIVLDSKLGLKFHVDRKIKVYKLISFIRSLSVNVPGNALLTIFKLLIRLHVDYGEILYDKPETENFQNKLEKAQYRACLATTGAMQGTLRQKLYNKPGLHSLSRRRWFSKQIFFIKY